MNGIDLMSVVFPVLNNDINTVPSKFQMVSIYVTSGTEQSSEQAVTVTVDLHDTQGVLNTASVEKDGLLDARLGVAMLCIGACMEDGGKDEGGGGA
jgi:hypothetical protein